MNFISIIALLQAAVALLTATVGTPAQEQAILIANQAISIAQNAIVQQVEAPAVTIQNQSTPPATSQPAVEQVQSAEAQVVATPAPTMKTIEIISPIEGKGIGREFLAREGILDELNYIELGAIIRNENGEPDKTVEVNIVSTDASQGKKLAGTGDVKKMWVNGSRQLVPYYPFHYEFKTPGEHEITFTIEGVSQSVKFTVTADQRK